MKSLFLSLTLANLYARVVNAERTKDVDESKSLNSSQRKCVVAMKFHARMQGSGNYSSLMVTAGRTVSFSRASLIISVLFC